MKKLLYYYHFINYKLSFFTHANKDNYIKHLYTVMLNAKFGMQNAKNQQQKTYLQNIK